MLGVAEGVGAAVGKRPGGGSDHRGLDLDLETGRLDDDGRDGILLFLFLFLSPPPRPCPPCVEAFSSFSSRTVGERKRVEGPYVNNTSDGEPNNTKKKGLLVLALSPL